MTVIDLVVPVRNEQDNLSSFIEKVHSLSLPSGCQSRLIFVEDGSKDNTVSRLCELSSIHKDVSYYSLEIGRGQGAAIMFGLAQSSGDAAIMLDIDGTHPVEVIPEMIDKYLAGSQVVQGIRTDISREPSLRKIFGTWFRFLFTLATGVDLARQSVCYRLISKEVKERILAEPRLIYLIRLDNSILLSSRVSFVEFQYQPRSQGVSNYSFYRLTKLALLGTLSSISRSRFMTLLLTGSIVALSLKLLGYEIASLILSTLILITAICYFRIANNTILADLRVKEHN